MFADSIAAKIKPYNYENWGEVMISGVRGAVRAVVLISCLVLVPLPSRAEVQVLDRAQRSEMTVGAVPSPVRLPDSWTSSSPMRSGRWTYTLRFGRDGRAPEDLGVYLPRAGNRLQLEWNGHPLGGIGDLDNPRQDFSQYPHYFAVPSAWVLQGENVLRIGLSGEPARYAGLSQVLVGPPGEVMTLYRRRLAEQVGGSVVMVSLSLLLAAVALAMCIRMPDSRVLLFGLACLLWGVRTTYALVTEPVLPYQLWGWLMDMSYVSAVVLLAFSALQVLGLLKRWALMLGAGVVAICAAFAAAYVYAHLAWARNVWLFCLLAFVLVMVGLFVRQWWRHPTFASRVLMLASAAGGAMGAYDHVTILYGRQGYGGFAIARFALMAFVLAMATLLVRRQQRTMRIALRARQRMQHRLAESRRELTALYHEREQQRVQEVLTGERQRIMRDMHDGLGAQLAGMLSLLRSDAPNPSDIEQHVREAIDELRITIDSLEPIDGDLATVLGALRHRLDKRFSAAGIELVWDVQPLPALEALTPRKVQHVQRIVQEAFTNIIKHSKARSVTVEAKSCQGTIHIDIHDDGQGFDTSRPRSGHGLANMRQRAAEAGGSLALSSSPASGTRLSLTMPVS